MTFPLGGLGSRTPEQAGQVGSRNPGALRCPGRRVHTRGTSSTPRSQRRLALPLRADPRQLPGTGWLCPRVGRCGPVTWMLKGAEGTDSSVLPQMPIGPREASLAPSATFSFCIRFLTAILTLARRTPSSPSAARCRLAGHRRSTGGVQKPVTGPLCARGFSSP